MKKVVLLAFVFIAFLACTSQKQIANSEETGKTVVVENEDSTEYELIVFDPAYETFLQTQPYPKWYYSNDYYQYWNYQYVIEWNYRYTNPEVYGDFYENMIDYDLNVDYGLDLNYRLYQYFQFIEKQYGIVLIPRKGNYINARSNAVTPVAPVTQLPVVSDK